MSAKCALPPSQKMSPSSKCPLTSSSTASVAPPAFTIEMTRRGRASEVTSSSTVSAPVNSPSSAKESMNAVIFSVVRL